VGDQSKDEKKFNLQVHLTGSSDRIEIPWEHAESAYVEYSARFGTGQSLERLHVRGGFGVEEIIKLMHNRLISQEEKIKNMQKNLDSGQQEILRLQRQLKREVL
jgi:hypothetical protein